MLFTTVEDAHRFYFDTLKEARRHGLRMLDEAQRFLLRNDLFYLGVHGCGLKHMDRPFLLERCQVVRADPDGFLDLWAREHFKDLDCDTPVLTTRGWKRHGDLNPGDEVFTPDGGITRVVATQHFADSACRKVSFRGGAELVAGAGHLWRVLCWDSRRKDGEKREGWVPRVVRTDDLLRGYKRPKIPVAESFAGRATDLPVDPYLLGVWLGDGESSSGRICGQDVGVFLEVERRGYRLSSSHCPAKAPFCSSTVYGLGPSLRALGVLGNKHVPWQYLVAPIADRLALLQGLMDTDGNQSTGRNSHATFANSNKRLAEDALTLACSLGFKARLSPSRTTNSWQVCFQTSTKDQHSPFLLCRKTDSRSSRLRNSASSHWYVQSVQAVETRPTNCIQVEAAHGMYLAGRQLIPTHNSTIGSFLLLLQDILRNPEITIGIFSVTRPLAKDLLRVLKNEMENNRALQRLFPEILWTNPKRESPKWSEDEGLIVRRKTNPREATVEAHGLVDSMPTGKHFQILNYDDVVTERTVGSPEMMKKTTEMLRLSYSLGRVDAVRRMWGTRYHLLDALGVVIKDKVAIPRIVPCTKDGKENGEPVFWTREQVAEKRRDQGPYIFGCHGAGTLVTMSDWSQKKIEDVRPGDEVVGWAHVQGGRAILTPTRVVATNTRIAPLVRSVLENGDTLVHTPDHKWWTGRAPNGARKTYSPLGFGPGTQHGLCQVINVSRSYVPANSDRAILAAGYLGAMIDGEGAVRHRSIQITQDPVLNPVVCAKIEWSLETLGFDFHVHEFVRERGGTQRTYTVRGGREEKVRLLSLCGEALGKAAFIASQCYGARDFGKGRRVKLAFQEGVGDAPVYNIQTETGNYVASGYASKNCQYLLNPTADAAMGFKPEWLRYYVPKSLHGMNIYMICDPAGEKKKGSDYTVIEVMGLSADRNVYTIKCVRARMNLTERTRTLIDLHRQFRPIKVGYEKYGKDSDIEHIKTVMDDENYRFAITPLGGSMAKNDRIRRLVPLFEKGRWYLPQVDNFVDPDGRVRNATEEFVTEELLAFPVSTHDDMLDTKSRLLDPDFKAVFPAASSPLLGRPDTGVTTTSQGWR